MKERPLWARPEIARRVGPHTSRHSFATHLLEDGVDIRIIQALVYDLLLKAASQTMMTIAADPKHLGARIGITAVPGSVFGVFWAPIGSRNSSRKRPGSFWVRGANGGHSAREARFSSPTALRIGNLDNAAFIILVAAAVAEN